VDKTLGFVIVRDLNDLFRFYKRQVIGGLTVLLEHMQAELNPTSTLPALADKMYKVALERTAKLWPWFAGDARAAVGRLVGLVVRGPMQAHRAARRLALIRARLDRCPS